MSYETTSVLAAMKTRAHSDFSLAMGAIKPFWNGDGAGFMTVVPSRFALETYSWLADIGDAREWLGSREVERLKERSFQVINKTYEKTVGIDEEKLEDNAEAEGAVVTAGEISKRIAYAMARIPDVLRTFILQNGQSILGYDGQNLFDTDHPTSLDNASGSQSNYWASGLALSAANFLTARARLMTFRAENGLPRPFDGTLVLEVPPALEGEGRTILEAQYGANGSTNITRGMARLVVNPLLAGQDTTWYLWISGGAGVGVAVLQERRKPRLVTKNSPTDDNMFWDREAIFGGDARYGAAPGAWWRAIKAAA